MTTPPTAEKTERRSRRWRRIGALLVGMFCLFVLDYYAFPYGTSITAPSPNRSENGLWLRYTWYFGQHTDTEVRDLAWQLQAQQIRDAYFHVRGITGEGRLKYRYAEQAQHLLSTLHQETPDVRRIAWVYVGNRYGEGEVDLSKIQVRKAMTAEALWLVKNCGFDGVQWDYEICDDGDADFLRLLQETRAVLPPGKLLSVATPMWLPRPLRAWGWSDAYFTKVAASCDQITVMCYDSGFALPRSYVWLLRQQPLHVTQDVARGNIHCRVLFGLPTYGEGFRSHNPRAENLRLALRGIREGLAEPGVDLSVFAGIAPFADYTTDDRDWRTYNALWLQPSSQPGVDSGPSDSGSSIDSASPPQATLQLAAGHSNYISVWETFTLDAVLQPQDAVVIGEPRILNSGGEILQVEKSDGNRRLRIVFQPGGGPEVSSDLTLTVAWTVHGRDSDITVMTHATMSKNGVNYYNFDNRREGDW